MRIEPLMFVKIYFKKTCRIKCIAGRAARKHKLLLQGHVHAVHSSCGI